MATKKVYVATLYRFGYDLVTVANSEEEAKKAIMAEYVRAYKQNNGGIDPRDEEDFIYGGTMYENAEEDIEIREYTPGVVEWE